MKGLPQIWQHFKDELYGKTRGPVKNMEILATAYDNPNLDGTGRNETILWTVKYGVGSVFVTLIGHVGNDPNILYSMECTGFKLLFLGLQNGELKEL